MNENPDFGSEFDAALNRQMDSDMLQISFLSLLSIRELVKVSNTDFHEALILRNDAGQVTNYLPDTLEAFENSVEMLDTILDPYKDKDFAKPADEDKKLNRDERRKEGFKKAKALFQLMKRINLVPGENTNLVEIIGKTKTARKEAKKDAKAEGEEADDEIPSE